MQFEWKKSHGHEQKWKQNLLDGTTYYAFKIPVTYSCWNLITSYFYCNTCKKRSTHTSASPYHIRTSIKSSWATKWAIFQKITWIYIEFYPSRKSAKCSSYQHLKAFNNLYGHLWNRPRNNDSYFRFHSMVYSFSQVASSKPSHWIMNPSLW